MANEKCERYGKCKKAFSSVASNLISKGKPSDLTFLSPFQSTVRRYLAEGDDKKLTIRS